MPGEVCKMKATLDALFCGAALVDARGLIAHANPRLETMLGYPSGGLNGTELATLCAIEHDRAQLGSVLQRFHEPAESELNLQRKGGGVVPVIASGNAVSATVTGDRPGLRVMTLIDVSSQRELVRQTAELTKTVSEQAHQIREQNNELEQRVVQRTQQLRRANLDAVLMLAVASEARDDDTGEHVRRIEHLARRLALATGMPDPDAEHLGLSAILHDIGKIHIPDRVLKKPGPLTDDERDLIQTHPLAGEAILGNNPFFALARTIARHHHEDWNGRGYPDGLAGTDIPLAARIVRLVDVYDALRSPRIYKPSWSAEQALAEITQKAGELFDPHLVHLFCKIHDEADTEQGVLAYRI
ncbi:MAG: HD domain-containing phosphohydrolase [Planctomycetota bacterium]